MPSSTITFDKLLKGGTGTGIAPAQLYGSKITEIVRTGEMLSALQDQINRVLGAMLDYVSDPLVVNIDLSDIYYNSGTVAITGMFNIVGNKLVLNQNIHITNGLPVYADNAAALTGGLVAGDLYQTNYGAVYIVF